MCSSFSAWGLGTLHRVFSPQMVVNSKGKGTPYFREIQIGEIL